MQRCEIGVPVASRWQPMTVQSLPMLQRLALSYAPRSSRDEVLALMLLDERLAAILRDRGEVMIAQIKLAWWRDRLAEDPARWPAGEPLLERLQGCTFPPSAMAPLVDGWERMLDEELSVTAMEEFAGGRAQAWSAICPDRALTDPVIACARQWALADLALNLGNAEEASAARGMALAERVSAASLSRQLRPLAVMHGLAMRALHRGSADPLDGPLAGIAALRIGLLGR